MNSTTTYITKLLSVGKSTTAAFDKHNLESEIYKRLTSKKFRKTKMHDACADRTKKAISLAVSKQKKLKVVYPQGGYKLWRFPSSPEADWAEFFTISYLIDYLLPIANSYEPGVELVFYMHTLLMELHDNLTTEEIQAYVDSFQKLLDEFSNYLPDNFTLSILRDADLYARDEYFKKLECGKAKAAETYETWDESKKQNYLRMAKLNIKWDGKENWKKLSDKEKREKEYLAALYEIAATTTLEKVATEVKSAENILVFTVATPDFIGVGSTKTSLAKYWVGTGVLETGNDGKLRPRILTPSQYEKAMSMPHKTEEISVLSGKNFMKILIFPNSFNFTK